METAPKNPSLPDYEKPPVIEVVCGVQFKTLKRFLAAHFGAYWNTIRSDYPIVEDMPPLPLILDPGAKGGGSSQSIELELSSIPPLRREFFINKSENGLIQIQNNRFHYNWKREKDEDVYIRFPGIKKEFLGRWNGFRKFIDELGIGPIQQTQLELTYINHFFEGELWASVADLSDIIPPMHWDPPTESFLPVPDTIAWNISFPCCKCSGHLIIALTQGIRKTDGRRLFVLQLTVRGNQNAEAVSIEEWFDIAREWIVKGFTSITSNKAHTLWGRKA